MTEIAVEALGDPLRIIRIDRVLCPRLLDKKFGVPRPAPAGQVFVRCAPPPREAGRPNRRASSRAGAGRVPRRGIGRSVGH
jgi:hypothetical protein